MIGPVAADLAQRAHALVDDPARERPPAAVQRGDGAVGGEQDRQAVGDEDDRGGVGRARSPGRPPRCTGALGARRLGRAPHGRAVDLAAVAEARPRMADGSPSRRRFSSTFSGASSVSRPRFSDANGPLETPPRRVEKTARACGRSATIWSSSQRNGAGSARSG